MFCKDVAEKCWDEIKVCTEKGEWCGRCFGEVAGFGEIEVSLKEEEVGFGDGAARGKWLRRGRWFVLGLRHAESLALWVFAGESLLEVSVVL